jgi:glycosyltransferase involved in cell wall biosynthesis
MTSNNKKPFLSAALIVKNEEHNIRRCLGSLKGVCDEIIVVDTGSTDRTPEIVREYTDKLYFHEWQGSFSEARNNSLKYPTGDWVFIIDADEELSSNLKLNLFDELKQLSDKVNTVMLPTKSFLDVKLKNYDIATMPRIFRNGTVRYRNIVHNQAAYLAEIKNINLEILHYGYIWTRELRKKKYLRMKTMLNEHLNNINEPKEEIYYLCQLYKTELIGKKNHTLIELGLKIYEKILRNKAKDSPITFEFLFFFSLKLLEYGYLKKAKEIAEYGIKKYPAFPDTYFSVIYYHFLNKSYKELVDVARIFFEKYKIAMLRPDNLPLSVTAINYIQLVYFMLAFAHLSLSDLDKFKIDLRNGMSQGITKSPKAVLQDIVNKISNLEVTQQETLENEIVDLHKYVQNNNIILNWNGVIETLAEKKVQFDYYLESKSEFHNLIARRLVNSKEDFFATIILGKQSPQEFINKYGHLSLIFYYEFLKTTTENIELITKLSELCPFIENEISKGFLYAFIGDCYLKKASFKEAISNYKSAIEYYPDLRQFIKPILEDLTIELDSSIDGVFEEIKQFFMEKRELIFDFTAIISPYIIERLYMISDYYLAIYASAVNQRDFQKGIELLKKIEDRAEDLPFYYYHLGELLFKTNNFDESKKIFTQSLEEQTWLGDIKNKGRFDYTGYYFERKNKHYNKKDKIVWIGNISKNSTLYGVINPIKVWRMKQNGLIYSENVPDKEGYEAYEFQKHRFNHKKKKINLYLLKKILSKYANQTVNFIGLEEDDEIHFLLETFGISIDDQAQNLIVLKGLEEYDSIEEVIDFSKYSEGVLLISYPVNKTYDNPLWYSALNVCYRPPAFLKEYFHKKGYYCNFDIQENHNIISFKKGE